MATHQLAKGLASLGRHGDSMLMHVSPSEVAGLQAIGKMTGHKLHTNPHTGLPEAFDFGDFFTSLIPTGIGMLLGGPAGAAMGLKQGTLMATAAPVLGGMAAGAAVAGAKGDDVLTGSLMGGLGGYGGGNLAKTFGKMGATTAAQNAANLTPPPPQGIAESTIGGAGNIGPNFNPNLAGLPPLQEPVSVATSPNFAAISNAGAAPGTGGFQGEFASSLGDITSGIKQLAAEPFGAGYEAFQQAGGSALDLGAPLAVAGYEGYKENLFPKPDNSLEEKRKAEENKYRDRRTGLLNLSQARPDFGTKFLATGGTINNNSSTISTGGIQDLYGTNDQTTGTQSLSRDGYGIGRLNTLAAEGSRAKAADTFYAMGGPIAFAKGGHQGYLDGEGDGMSDSIPATIEGKQPARLADGEFVIPADVVSHIGNGSSKAGSKQLYSMLDRIRKARTGHTKQGKQIKPQKYMPA